MGWRRARRALVGCGVASGVLACGPRGDCERVERVYAPAEDGCPSLQEAERELRRPHVRYSVDGFVEATLVGPATVCWYRAVAPRWSCEYVSSRSELFLEKFPPAGWSPYVYSCDQDGLLYGMQTRAEPASVSEALALQPSECLDEAVIDEAALLRDPDLEVLDLVGQDFYRPLLSCSYETSYKCRQDGGPRGGSGTIGI